MDLLHGCSKLGIKMCEAPRINFGFVSVFHITWDDLILFQVGYILACHKIKLVHSHLFSQ